MNNEKYYCERYITCPHRINSTAWKNLSCVYVPYVPFMMAYPANCIPAHARVSHFSFSCSVSIALGKMTPEEALERSAKEEQ